MDKDTVLFKGKSFADVMADIYNNQKKKDTQIKLLIAQLQPLVTNVEDAASVVPLIKDYLDVSVKNDDALVKLAAIIQRMMKSESDESSNLLLSDSDKEQLIKAYEDLTNEIKDDGSIPSIDNIDTE